MSKVTMKRGKAAAGVAAAAEASVMKKPDGDWVKSSVKRAELDSLCEQGLLPPADQATVRAPGKEVFPAPREGERVCFVDFLPRGFGFPLHDFVRGLLYAYGIQIHDLTPNGVLSIATFFVLCECFLGIAPNWQLWKSLFAVRKNCGRNGMQYPVGGFGIQMRGDTAYFQMKKSDSVQGWRKRWFYIRCEQAGLPDFAADRELRKTKAWAHPLSKEDKEATKPLLGLLHGLLKTLGRETGGVHLMATFFRLRVQPLRARVHPMWAYEGVGDPDRTSPIELDDEAVESKVRNITSLRAADPCNVKCPVELYSPSNLAPEVGCVFSEHWLVFLHVEFFCVLIRLLFC